MKLSILSFLILSTAPHWAFAQQAGQPGGAPRWGLGVGAAVSESVYAGEGTRVTPFPLITYDSERFFWRGIGGGAYLLRYDGLSIAATLSARMDGIDKDDFGKAELAARGIDRDKLEDRDDSLDLGIAINWRGRHGELEFALKRDASGASKGHEASVKYGYPFQWGGARIVPHTGLSHLSSKMANYYYGTLPGEAARGVVDYLPGSAVVPRIGVDVVRPFAGRWAVIGNVSYRHLPGKLSDSPLVEKNTNGVFSAFVGVSRGF